MKAFTFILFLFLSSSCSIHDEEKTSDKIIINMDDVDVEWITVNKLELENDYYMSFYSFLQTNKSGLYVTPGNAVNDSVLLMVPNNISEFNSPQRLRGAIRQGRGPSELLNINLSARTADGDTLIFYSANGSAYITIDSEGNIYEKKENPVNIFTNGSSLGYSMGHFLFPSFHGAISRNNLLTIVNTNMNTEIHFFEPRIPATYEPAIRNQVFPIGALPGGFIFSFLGDRSAYVVDFDGRLKNVIVLGESDPIPEPFKVTDPSQSPRASPYIKKIEFYREHLLVLMDRLIVILEYPTFKPKKILKVKKSAEDDEAPVIDFSVSSDFTYFRIGRDGLFSVNTNPNWFN